MWFMEITGDDLRLARNYLDLTQAELADRLEVSLRTITNWELKGVPARRTPAVQRRLGPLIDEAKRALGEFEDSPPASYPSAAELEAMEEASAARWETWENPHGVRRGMSPDDRRGRLLSAFSDSDLLSELRARAARRGDRVNHWDAERYESYQEFVAPRWQEIPDPANPFRDPDYSNMSEEEAKNYGLAAHKGDPNIGPEDDPHET